MKFSFLKKSRIVPDLRESFISPYRGGEILTLLLDNLEDNLELIKEKILRNERFCLRPSSPSLVLYQLFDTEITDEVAVLVVDSLRRLDAKIVKLALGGVSFKGRRRINKYMKYSGIELGFPYRYFAGLEPAKEWLIEKRGSVEVV